MSDKHLGSITALLADFNCESEPDYSAIRELAISTYGVDPLRMYCLHTGKPMGTLDIDELAEAIYEESDDDELESVVDGLVVRTVISMRPSPALNKPDLATIREMSVRRPVDALAYLLNRLYGSRDLITKRQPDAFKALLERIKTHRVLNDSASTNFAALIHWLLELDSKLNLHDLTPPLMERDLRGKLILTKTGDSLVNFISDPQMLPLFESWVFERLHEWDKRDSEALAQLRWARGNRMTAPAFVRSYLDNPEIANRKRQEEIKRSEKRAAGRPKSEKTRKVDAKVSQFLHLLDEVLTGELPATPKPAPKPKLLRGNMLFAKKESN